MSLNSSWILLAARGLDAVSLVSGKGAALAWGVRAPARSPPWKSPGGKATGLTRGDLWPREPR